MFNKLPINLIALYKDGKLKEFLLQLEDYLLERAFYHLNELINPFGIVEAENFDNFAVEM